MSTLLDPRLFPGGRPPEPAGRTALPPPPSGARVLGVLAGVACRRLWNRLSVGGFLPRKKAADGSAGRRRATAGKQAGLAWASVLVALFFLLMGSFIGCSFACNLSDQLGLNAGEETNAVVSDPSPPEQGAVDGTGDRFFHSGAIWPLPPNDRLMASAVGLVLLLTSLFQLATVLGYGNQDLGKVEWDMEWLFTFPVPAWTLFLGRLVQYVTAGQMVWWSITAPFLTVIYWCAGYGWWAIPLALAAASYGALLTASLGLAVETLVQKKLSPARRKNLQAVLGLVGGWSIFCFIGLIGWNAFAFFVAAAVHWLPVAVWANPFSLPALLCVSGGTPFGAAAGMLLLGVAAPVGAVRLAGRLVRDGLVAVPSGHQGSRRRWRADLGKIAGLFRGVIGKDLRLLMRDKAFLLQTLVLPVLLCGFQFVTNWQGGVKQLQDASLAPALAFMLGVVTLGFSAFQVLAAEGGTLWLLYTFPRKLHSVLLQKTLLWCGFAVLYVLAVLTAAALLGMPLTGNVLMNGVFAVVGIVIHAFIASALGTLATNPLAAVTQRRVRLDLVWFNRFLGFIYLLGFFSESLWWKVVLVVLYAPLAYAFWQKVQDRIPYFLEPAEAPPPRVSLADGLVAVLAYCVLQILVHVYLVDVQDLGGKLSEGTLELIQDVTAGSLATIGVLFFLRRAPDLLMVTGLAPPRTGPRPTVWRVAAPGVAAGVVAGFFAVAYIAVLLRFEVIPSLKQELAALPSPLAAPSFFAVAVLAAPLIEEFLFRGLIFQGLRRSVRPIVAVLVSAAIFAVVHPPLSVVPVFVLGVAAALSFQRSRLLWTPILAHAVYNAIVVLAKPVIAQWMM